MMRHSTESGLLGKLVALMVGTVLLIVGLMLSLVLFAIIVAVGLAAWGYFWWKMRKLRKVMREQQTVGHVIDGEAIIIEENHVSERNTLPRDPPLK